MGRVDDVVNVAGHRLGTMEVESALVAHEKVAEAAVVGRPDDLKGQALCAFVTVCSGIRPDDKLKEELKLWVAKEIGSIAKPMRSASPTCSQNPLGQDHAAPAARHSRG